MGSPRAWPSTRATALGVAALAVSACAGSGVGLDETGEPASTDLAMPDGGGGDGGAGTVSFRELQSKIFAPVCAAHCHVGAAAPKNLQLDAAHAFDALVGVTSVEVPSMKRVDPGHPESSYLLVKIVPTEPRRQGDRMPRSGPPFLNDAQIKSIRRWIQEGARR